ncbi:protein FAR1-RELATED SEQUENCE 5-like [Olea europaea var. sylvestris]|uniref:protein FAR1-RELATED SEQUENCE 5-like n=1 Tax=Olea europaea var. sylvestris TaxID=158386 RepID=UPI000C1CD1FF|nr:protein FAR1-RELATED SEQUENCE 5-like [Olea europaea var. sylvestris]
MHGQAPNGIITDQDRAMQNAIEIIFPNMRHRWCLWHILKKLSEMFGNRRHKNSILSSVHGLVYDTQSPLEFEEKWHTKLVHYERQEHGWLTGLYNDRRCWVPCYLKNLFWAGMSTTQRSESINAFFDGYVHSKASLKQFVEQYERALRSKVEKEFQADFKSFSQMVPCATRYDMEKQFQLVYTISKFKEFRQEFTGKVYCEILSVTDSYFDFTYEVRKDIISNEGMKKQIFTVSFRRENCEFECNCHLFEFRGIICKHAISVLIRNDVVLISKRYILKRWRRDVNRPYMRFPIKHDDFVSSAEQVRDQQLCNTFTKLADVIAHDEQQCRRIMD